MRNRITIQTTEELDNALDEICTATGRTTKSDVVRDAIELYDLVVQHVIAGENLFLGTTRESAAAVLLPQLQRAAKRVTLQVVPDPPTPEIANSKKARTRIEGAIHRNKSNRD